jgi:hypothetical protein
MVNAALTDHNSQFAEEKNGDDNVVIITPYLLST